LLGLEQFGRAGEFEEPRGIAERHDGAEHPGGGGGIVGEIHHADFETVDGQARHGGREFGRADGGEAELVAPAVDVGEFAADIAGEGGHGEFGGGAVRAGHAVGGLAHGGGGFALPAGGGGPLQAGAVGGAHG